MGSGVSSISVQLDYKELQQFQDIYSSVTRLFMFCMANDGQGINRVTDFSGDPVEIDRLLGLLSSTQIESMVLRVLGSSLEEQVVEDTEFSNIKVASVGVKVSGKPVFCWYVCGILENDDDENAVKNFHTLTTEAEFLKSVDLLRQASKRMYGGLYDDILKGYDKSSNAEKTLDTDSVRRYQSMNEIIQMLDSDEPFDDIANNVIKKAAEYVGISHSYIISLANRDSIEVLAEYYRED